MHYLLQDYRKSLDSSSTSATYNNLHCVPQLHHFTEKELSNETKPLLGIAGTGCDSSAKDITPNLQVLTSVTVANTGGMLTVLISVGPLLLITTHQDFTVCSCSCPHPLEH